MMFLCIHGNHEIRPQNIRNYKETVINGNKAWVESEFPNIYFLQDGAVYNINGISFLVVGGAYSATRMLKNNNEGLFFDDEQPSSVAKESVKTLCEKGIDAV